MEEQTFKRNRERIDEAKGFIKQYGKDAALLYLLKLPPNSDERMILLVALVELT